MPIGAQINGRLYAIDSDHLNTPRRLTNAQGQVVWQWLITGYGEVAPTTGATGYAFEAPQLGGSSNSSGNVYSEEVNFKLRYPGQVWDEETGLSYNLNRYYDAQAGRYVQSDPIGLEGGWNRFGYVGGDPLNQTDPRGLDHPGMGPYAVGASVYYYAGGPGHIGIGVNGGKSIGYYPTPPSKTNYEFLFPGVPGALRLDRYMQSQPDKSVWLDANVESVERLKNILKRADANPGTYSLPFNNCTTFAAGALRDAGFRDVPFSLIPLNFIESLEIINGKK